MKAKESKLEGVIIIEVNIYEDTRGFFMESFNRKKYKEIGITKEFVQDNLSYSRKNILRGLHFQNPNAQAKLVSVIKGEVYDVVADLRKESPTFACWDGFLISEKNQRQVYVPEGFAHGFVTLSEDAYFYYKCSDYYSPGSEYCIRWDDPDLDIKWLVDKPALSEKDQNGVYLKELPVELCF